MNWDRKGQGFADYIVLVALMSAACVVLAGGIIQPKTQNVLQKSAEAVKIIADKAYNNGADWRPWTN